VIAIISQTFVTRALLLLFFIGLVERRVKEEEYKKGVDIRFSFLRVCIGEFNII
jgi:hypothetical protein